MASDQDKFPLVARNKNCSLKKAARVGIRQLSIMKLTMRVELVLNLFANSNLRSVRMLRRKYLNSDNPIGNLTTIDPPRGSVMWNCIQECRHTISQHATLEIRNEGRASFWMGSWSRKKLAIVGV